MSIISRIFRKLIIIFVLLSLAVCPYVFVGIMFAPQAISFLEPVVCPDDMTMEMESSQRRDSEGTHTSVEVICVDNQRDVDVTWKLALIMLGFPALGVIVFFIMPSSSEEQEKTTLDPEGTG
jgi:hypothetical protein